MINREEILKKFNKKLDEIEKLEKESKDFYSYERDFDKTWTEMGKEVLEDSMNEGGRKKKFKPNMGK